jgi:hypothetical protein
VRRLTAKPGKLNPAGKPPTKLAKLPPPKPKPKAKATPKPENEPEGDDKSH